MRTHAENDKLKHKAEARRERQQERRVQKKKEKVQKLRALPDASDTAEIERRKALFQAKKARRLARKEAAAGGGGDPKRADEGRHQRGGFRDIGYDI